LTLAAAAANSVVITGDGLLTLTNTDTTITSLNASGIIDHAAATGTGGLTWATGALAGANTITGSATGANTIDWTSSTAAATTYVGGSGADVLVFTNAKNNVITLGDGANSINTGAAAGTGNNTITGGAGADTVKLTSGNNTVNLGNGANTFQVGAGNNTYVGGTGVDQVTVGGGQNTITVGAGADIVTFSAVSSTGNNYSTVTDIAVGDKIVFTDAGQVSGTSTFVTAKISLLPTAAFADYLIAASASTAAATNSVYSWFQYGGNTYIVEDNSASATFDSGVDSVVQLTGLVTVNGFAAVATTSATFTLA